MAKDNEREEGGRDRIDRQTCILAHKLTDNYQGPAVHEDMALADLTQILISSYLHIG